MNDMPEEDTESGEIHCMSTVTLRLKNCRRSGCLQKKGSGRSRGQIKALKGEEMKDVSRTTIPI